MNSIVHTEIFGLEEFKARMQSEAQRAMEFTIALLDRQTLEKILESQQPRVGPKDWSPRGRFAIPGGGGR